MAQGRVFAAREPFGLHDTLLDVIANAQPAANDRRIVLELDVNEDLTAAIGDMRCLGDAPRLHQVMENITPSRAFSRLLTRLLARLLTPSLAFYQVMENLTSNAIKVRVQRSNSGP